QAEIGGELAVLNRHATAVGVARAAIRALGVAIVFGLAGLAVGHDIAASYADSVHAGVVVHGAVERELEVAQTARCTQSADVQMSAFAVGDHADAKIPDVFRELVISNLLGRRGAGTGGRRSNRACSSSRSGRSARGT